MTAMTHNHTVVTPFQVGTMSRGRIGSNGVHTVLTQAAVEADMALQVIRANTILVEAADVEALMTTVAHGTFTFVRREHFAAFRGLVTGTLDELANWTRGRSMAFYYGANPVPFGNGDLNGNEDYVRTVGEVVAAFGLIPQPAR